MLKYSKSQKFSVSLMLINNDGSPESDATVSYNIYNESNTLEVSGGTVTYNSTLGAYVDVIDPSIDWINQKEGLYFVKWAISDTTEDYPNYATEELYIESYDEKLDEIITNTEEISANIDTAQVKLNRLLGLSHENCYIDNPTYDKWDNLESARMRIYSDAASVGTNANVIGTYTITAETFNMGKFNTWKQIKN